jgi:hypothetical protein
MKCGDIDQALTGGPMAAPLQPDVEHHLKTCARCRQLVAALSLPVPAAQPSPETLRRIEASIATDLRPVRPIARKGYLLVGLVAIFMAIVALAVSRLGALAITVMTPVQTSMILGALAISAGLLANSLVNQIVPGSRHRISPRLLPIGISIFLTIVVAVLFPFQHEQNFWANCWTCLRAGTPIGVLAAVPLWFALRRGAILSPSMTGAATGTLAGLVGATVLEIHCPNLDAWHILVAHLGAAAIGATTGLLIGTAVGGKAGLPNWIRACFHG